jgi:hypothetical protein
MTGVIIDTNVDDNKLTWCVSPAILAEYESVLTPPKFSREPAITLTVSPYADDNRFPVMCRHCWRAVSRDWQKAPLPAALEAKADRQFPPARCVISASGCVVPRRHWVILGRLLSDHNACQLFWQRNPA